MRLYKYFRPERLDGLRNRRICFSRPSTFNDPFDCLPHFAESRELNPVGSRTYFLQARPEDISRPELREEVQNHVRRSYEKDPSFTLHAVMLVEPMPADGQANMAQGFREYLKPEMQNSMVVLSLSENQNSLLMWAHYAADHSGFAIGFNAEHPYFQSAGSNPGNPGYLHRVVYAEERPSGVLGSLSVEKAYLTKSPEWGYEREWRVLQRASNASEVLANDVHLFAFPETAVAEVILGARMKDTTRTELLEVLGDKAVWGHVAIMQATVDERQYRLNYGPLGQL
jgi:hypothetical protein